jgi:hypothetical protein
MKSLLNLNHSWPFESVQTRKTSAQKSDLNEEKLYFFLFYYLQKVGFISLALGMFISVLFGFIFGLILGTTEMPWGFGDFPTEEMKGRYGLLLLFSLLATRDTKKEFGTKLIFHLFCSTFVFFFFHLTSSRKINDALFIFKEVMLAHYGWEYCGH